MTDQEQLTETREILDGVLERWAPFPDDSLDHKMMRALLRLAAYEKDCERVNKGERPIPQDYPLPLPSEDCVILWKEMLTKARAEGLEAGMEGKGADANPYATSEAHDAWLAGWRDSKTDVPTTQTRVSLVRAILARVEGLKASEEGKGSDANPYPAGSELHTAWLDGWRPPTMWL